MLTMWLTKFTVIGIIAVLWKLAGTDSCKFGPTCDYPCHCQGDTACDSLDGSCPTGCNDGNIMDPDDYWYTGAWSGYGCQIGNVAYNKTAEQGPQTRDDNVAERAIDGNHNPLLWKDHCTFAVNYNVQLAWWRVDLGFTYVVISINITNSRYQQARTTSTNIYVTNSPGNGTAETLCYYISSEEVADSLHVNCPRSMVGRYVLFVREPGGHQTHIMNLCEVQVFGYIYHDCPDEYFGVACGTTCNCRVACDDVTGECPGQNCMWGWTGSNCQTVCAEKTWGENCQEQCNCRDDQETCNHVDGSCRSGCSRGYEGTGCNTASSTGVNFGNVVGVVMAFVVVALGLLVVLIMFLSRRFLKRKNNHGKDIVRGATVAHIYEDIENGQDNLAVVEPECPSQVTNDASKGDFSEQSSKLQEKDCSFTNQSESDVDNTKTVNAVDIPGITIIGEPVPQLPIYDKHIYVNEDPLIYGNEPHIYGNEDPLEKPISVSQLALYIDDMSNRRNGFAEEFAEISTGVTAVSEEGQKDENKTLNRFKDICAYDHSRVVLNESEENRTGYINANYIHKYKEDPKGYIATQGPTKSTLIDFWSMVWQTDANRIVMVTKLREAKTVKCKQYWPDEGVMEIGKFKMNLVSTDEFAEYTVRVLSVIYEKSKPRAVYHFHFTGWPDNGIPEAATSLLSFRRKVRSRDDIGKGPLIVHCSAGIGRTGTFLAIDYLLEQAKAEGLVDVFKYTSLMRSNRMDMIQRKEQYEFVYKALLEALEAGETTIPSNEMETCYSRLKEGSDGPGKSKITEQFVLLQRLKSSRTPGPKEASSTLENIARNRDNNIVPLNRFRVHLKTKIRGTNDYINAVNIDGYRERRAYIATQLPLPNTVVDLWRLLYDHKCSSISLLEQPNTDDKSTPVFWPVSKDNPMVMRELTVSLLKDEELDEGAIHMMEFKIDASSKDSHTVRFYQFTQWGAETPPSMENTLQLLDHLQRWRLRSGHGAVCFQCKYGYERSGLMIAACYMLEKLKVDREVDVFQAVKQVRIPRPELVTSLVQYEFLHELAITYINSFENYANFK